MSKFVHAIAALVFSAGIASTASALDATSVAATVGAVTAAQPGRGWDRDIDVRCASRDFKYAMCQVDTGPGGRATLVRQISKTACIEGRTWGVNRAGVWVNQGCEGVFRVQRRGGGPGMRPGAGPWQPGPGWDKAIRVRCESPDFHYRMCQVDTGRGSAVRITRQISRTACVEGRTWGFNRAGIWVDKGCAAEFQVDRRWR